MSIETTDDRRGGPRKALRGQARLLWRTTTRWQTVRLLEVTATGLSFVSSAPVQAGSIADMEFDLPPYKGAPARRLAGEVKVANSVLSARDDGFRANVTFVRLPSDVRAVLDKYLG